MNNNSNKTLNYSFSFVVRHPSVDPASIDEALKLKPNKSWRSGDSKRDLDGNLIYGNQRESVWIYMENHVEDLKFFKKISIFLEELSVEKNINYICALVEDGARVNIDIRLPGYVNIGDQLSWQALELMGKLKINLSLEVFPDGLGS